MIKEITFRTIRIVLATVLALILFPFLENYFIEYTDQISFTFLLSSLIVAIVSIIIYLIIKKVRKNLLKKEQDDKSHILENIHYTLRLILLTAFAIYGLTLMKIYWVIIVLTGIEIYGLFFNEEFEQSKRIG